MISKILSSKSIGATIGYCLRECKGAQILAVGGVTGLKNPKLMIWQFEQQALAKPDLKNKLMHIIVSHPPEDRERIRGKEIEILSSFFTGLAKGNGKGARTNLTSTQFVVIKHNDKDHPHYHILANMVDNQGERLNDSNIGIRGKSVSIAVTNKFGLTRAVSKEYKEKMKQKITEEKQEIRTVQVSDSLKRAWELRLRDEENRQNRNTPRRGFKL